MGRSGSDGIRFRRVLCEGLFPEERWVRGLPVVALVGGAWSRSVSREGAKKDQPGSFVRARRPVPSAIRPGRFALSNRLAIPVCSSQEKSGGYPGWNRNWNWALHRLVPSRQCVSQEGSGKLSQEVTRGKHLVDLGFFPVAMEVPAVRSSCPLRVTGWSA
jgi:hypothetical protein